MRSDSEVLLDASALMAVVLDEPGGDLIGGRLERAHISPVNLAETIIGLERRGMPRDLVVELLDALGLTIAPCTGETASVAASIHAHTRKQGLSLGDCFCLATARALKAPVLTADRAWRRLDVGVAIEVVR